MPGVKNFSVGIGEGAPSTVRYSLNLCQWFRRRCSLKEKVYARHTTGVGQKPITNAHIGPMAQVN